jgi:hypothetical protein
MLGQPKSAHTTPLFLKHALAMLHVFACDGCERLEPLCERRWDLLP